MSEKPHILIVDDIKSSRLVLEMMLQDDYKISLVDSGLACLEFVEKCRPDLVLLDINMPGMNGYEVCKLLTEKQNSHSFPIIFVSSIGDTSNEEIGLSLGAVDYIIKPVNEAILKARVKTHLMLNSRTKALSHALNEAISLKNEIIAVNREKLESLEKMQTERLASLGTMVAAIAHEINTPIGLSVTNASELRDKVKAFKKMKTNEGIDEKDLNNFMADADIFTGLIQDNLTRSAALVRSFKQVTVDQTSKEERTFNLLEHIKSTMITLNHKFRNNRIQIKIECPEDLIISSYPGAFSQIITNLVNNSLIHAFDNGKEKGLIQIHIYPQLSKEEGSSLKLIYRDNGKGIDKAHCAQLFDPFFTTRRDQGGSGLGTHIVHNLVTQTLQGKITLTSEKDKWVCFEIDIPIKHL